MVPKGSEGLEDLDNWRNLMMLTTTYKIILKILIGKIEANVARLVDKQKTEFVKGRCIIDNLIA